MQSLKKQAIIIISIMTLAASGIYYARSIADENKPPGKAGYYKKKGDQELTQRNTLAAIDYYRKSLQVNPNYGPALTAIGSLSRETGDLTASLDYLQRAHKVQPGSKETIIELAKTWLAFNETARASEILDKGLSEHPQNVDYNYLKAEVYLLQGRPYLAQKKLNQILKMHPDHYESFLTSGKLYLRQKRFDAASEMFSKARLIRPESPETFIEMARVHIDKIIQQKDDLLYDNPGAENLFQPAIEVLMNAKGFDNYYVPANIMMARIYALTSECEKALPYLESVFAVNRQHYEALYYAGYCDKQRSLSLYPQMLKAKPDDEITRYIYEKNMINILPRREHPDIMAAVRLHFNRGQDLNSADRLVQGTYEIRYSRMLFPEFLPAVEFMFNHYRSQNDFYRMTQELNFLRRETGKTYYQDLYEKSIVRRREKLYYIEGFKNPVHVKERTKLFVFYFKPVKPLGAYPDAGMAIADKLLFALEGRGRVEVLPVKMREKMMKEVQRLRRFGFGGYYSARAGMLVQKLSESGFAEASSENNLLSRSPLRYAVAGDYSILSDGMRIEMKLIDMQTGRRFGEQVFTARGRGFLRKIAIAAADHIYEQIPYYGKIIKISRNGAVINLGKREGLTEKSRLQVMRNGTAVVTLKIRELDVDMVWATPVKNDEIYYVRKGDIVTLAPPEKEQPARAP